MNTADCEYDFVLEITELPAGPNDASTLPATTADLNVVANTKQFALTNGELERLL